MTTIAKPSQSRRPPRKHAQALLHEMLRIRRFEDVAAEQYQAGKIRGFLHLYIGEEAVAVGAMQTLTAEDNIVATYREHGQALARGLPAGSLMAELYGKANGCSRGRGGSMHFFDVSRRFYGGNGIVAGGIPIAVGLALADALRDERRVTACFFGEGAVAEGEFSESANLAALWKLPVLFLCENNLYAMGTPLVRSEAQIDLCTKAEAQGVQAEAVDGMDLLAVERVVREAAEAVRAGGGPRFVELRTYRFRGHSMSDPQLYRGKEEVERWRQRDPIALFVKRLEEWELLTEAERLALDQAVEAEMQAAVDEAESGPWEPVEDLTKYVTSR